MNHLCDVGGREENLSWTSLFVVEAENIPFVKRGDVYFLNDKLKAPISPFFQRDKLENIKTPSLVEFFFAEREGRLKCFIQPHSDELKTYLKPLKNYLSNGRSVFFIKEIGGDYGGKDPFLFISEEGTSFGFWKGKIPSQINHRMISLSPFERLTGVMDIAERRYFYHMFWPKPRLVFFGSDELRNVLERFGKELGFRMANIPPFLQTGNETLEEIVEGLTLGPYDFVLIFTMDDYKDRHILAALRNDQVYYLGVAGSHGRLRTLLGKRTFPDFIEPIPFETTYSPMETAIMILQRLINILNR